MNRTILRFATATVFSLTAVACFPGSEKQAPLNESLRPWKNDAERVELMFAVAAFAASGSQPHGSQAHGDEAGGATKSSDPTPNACIQRTLEELHKPQDDVGEAVKQLEEPRNTPADEKRDDPAPVKLRQDSSPAVAREPDPLHDCRDALRSCGNCHMPKQNNCNYTVEYSIDGKTVRRASGQFDVAQNGTLTERPGFFKEEVSSNDGPIASKDVVRTVWLNGADPVITWWDFKQLNGRGSTAKRMMAIAAQHNVACSNCHVGHGDFQLTQEGETFFESGKVIHRVPLKEMLGK